MTDAKFPERTAVIVVVGKTGDWDGPRDVGKLLEGADLNIQADLRELARSDVTAIEAVIEGYFDADDHDHLRYEMDALKARVPVDVAMMFPANRRKRLLISDMDSTIIQQECLDELADFAGLKAEISAITERAMRGELDFEAALTTRVAMLEGLDLSALQACYDERISLMPGAKTLVQTMTAHGAYCMLVSGGFTFFTQRVAAAAGFHAHRGNTLLDDGCALTGQVGLPILGREAKQTALEEAAIAQGVALADALAIGDGANDLAMIQAAGLGIAYEAKPIVAAGADAAISHTDLRTALFFQGYHEHEFVE